MITETKNAFTSVFGSYVCDGDHIDTEQDKHGRFFRATVQDDNDMGPPWKESDGHGPVSDWRERDSKRPGERVLYDEGGSNSSVWFYDYAEAIKIAKADGWDAEPYGQGTPGERAARAVEADFKALQGWCKDEWRYVGIVLSLHQVIDDEELELDDHLDSCWGIDANYPASKNEYLTEVANQLLEEAKTNAKANRLIINAKDGAQ